MVIHHIFSTQLCDWRQNGSPRRRKQGRKDPDVPHNALSHPLLTFPDRSDPTTKIRLIEGLLSLYLEGSRDLRGQSYLTPRRTSKSKMRSVPCTA
jgi:hypothetical protein